MRRTLCFFCPLLVLLTVLLAGCDSNESRAPGSFQAEVQGALNTQLEGSAQFSVFTDEEDDTPTSFEIRLFAETGPNRDIIVRSADDSGAPQVATYSVEQTVTGAASNVVRAELTDRANASLTIYEGETGIFEITRVTDTIVEGQFDFDAVDGSSGERITVTGRFIAQQP